MGCVNLRVSGALWRWDVTFSVSTTAECLEPKSPNKSCLIPPVFGTWLDVGAHVLKQSLVFFVFSFFYLTLHFAHLQVSAYIPINANSSSSNVFF